MLLSLTLDELKKTPPAPLFPGIGESCVVIGNFDGVHLGHQALFRYAKETGMPTIAVTFDPHPREVLSNNAPPRLLDTEDRLALLAEAGAAYTLLLTFSKALAALSPENFVQNILVARLAMKHLVIGYDFKLGRGRSGDADRLRELGGSMGFKVDQLQCLTDAGGNAISSTNIRECLQKGDVAMAAQLLGRAHTVRGVVIHGQHLGHKLGFPTANLDPNLPGMEAIGLALPGVYATRALLPAPGHPLPAPKLHTLPTGTLPDGAEVFPAVTNIGYKPTFDCKSLSVETHIPGLNRDLYGQPMALSFIQRLRGEQKFATLDDLKKQIRRDLEQAVALSR